MAHIPELNSFANQLRDAIQSGNFKGMDFKLIMESHICQTPTPGSADLCMISSEAIHMYPHEYKYLKQFFKRFVSKFLESAIRSMTGEEFTFNDILNENPSGADLIKEERIRQITKKNYAPKDDDKWTCDELARAAVCYAMPQDQRSFYSPDVMWPWIDNWKPTPDDRIKELTKAGALIAAEIDRLQRQTK